MKKILKHQDTKPQVQFQIIDQYLKNSAFMAIGVPEIFAKIKKAFKIELSIDVKVIDKSSGIYEVSLDIKVKALKDIITVLTVDVEYAGLFQIIDESTEEQKQQILKVYCPNLIFPFARSVIANITREGGFMPLMLDPVDFAGLYVQKCQHNETLH